MEVRMKRHEDVKVSILPDGMIAMQLEGDDIVHILTPIGGLVWEFCDGTKTIEEVIYCLGQIEGILVTADTRAQVEELIADLQKRGFLAAAVPGSA